jgi:hypothetical protein
LGKYNFELRVDKPFTDPADPTKKLPMIHVKERDNKSKSRPDAELVEVTERLWGGICFVVDAKFY